MVIVEQGPWPTAEVESNLRRVQERLYGCLDAAVDGDLAQRYPASHGKSVVIQLDCYNVPEAEVREFFGRFSVGALSIDDYAGAVATSPFVSGISFEITCSHVH